MPDPTLPPTNPWDNSPAFAAALAGGGTATVGNGGLYNVVPPGTGGSGGTATPGSGPTATPAGLGLTVTPAPNQAAIEAAQKATTAGYTNGPPDEATVRADTLKGFQSEIDALDRAAAQARERVTSQYRAIGNRRLGSNRALEANSGMLGQVAGAAQESTIESANADELTAAVALSDAQYADRKATLLGQARTMAAAAYQAKLDAYTKGAESTLQYIKDKQTTAESNAAKLAKQALLAGIDLTTTTNRKDVESYAKQLGVTPDVLISAYGEAKSAAAKAKLEEDKIRSEIIKNGQTVLKEGEVLYDATGKEVARGADKPITLSEGDVILNSDGTVKYKNQRTAAPVASDGGYVDTGIDPSTVNTFLQGKTDAQKAAFNGISDLQKSNVMQLLDGDVLLSDLVKSRGAAGSQMAQELLAAARSVDPSFSENVNKQRYAFKQKWNDSNGKAYIQRNSINTAIGHLARLKQLTDQLQGVNFQLVNGVIQKVQKNLNTNQTAAIAEFQDTVSLLAEEIAKAYKGGVPDQPEIERQLASLNVKNPKDVNSAVINNKVHLLNSLLQSVGTEYKSTMGAYPEQLLHREVLDGLQAAGVDTHDITKVLIQQGMKASSLNDYWGAFPDTKTKTDQMMRENPNLSEQDVLEILQGPSPYFNNVGADTNQGSDYQVKGMMQRIPLMKPITFGTQNYTSAQTRNLSYAPSGVKASVQLGKGAAVANNNPGNLRNVDGSWQKFATAEDGFKALMGYVERAKTGDHSAYKPTDSLYNFFSRYAPSSDNNNPKGYAEAVAKQIGVSPSTPINKIDTFKLAQAIARHDSSSIVTRIA